MKIKKIMITCFLFIVMSNVITASSSKDTLYVDGAKEGFDFAKLEQGNYKKIIIHNIALKKIPQEIYKNSRLEYLDLSNTSLTSVSSELNKLKELKTLVLRNNQLNNFNHITNLTNLEYLDLSGNNLNNIKSITNYQKLNNLDLSYNAFNSVGNLQKLNKLKSLSLSNNQLICLNNLPKGITNINLDQNYLNIKNTCVNQYKRQIKNQNTIQVKKGIVLKQIYYVMNYPEYTKQLLISSNKKGVVDFKNYILKVKAENKIYSIKQFVEKYQDKEDIEFSILVDVVNYENKKYIAYGREFYRYTGNYLNIRTESPEAVGFIAQNQSNNGDTKEDETLITSSDPTLYDSNQNYFSSNSFKFLSFIACLIFIIPLIIICIIFLYLKKMNRDVDKVLQSA